MYSETPLLNSHIRNKLVYILIKLKSSILAFSNMLTLLFDGSIDTSLPPGVDFPVIIGGVTITVITAIWGKLLFRYLFENGTDEGNQSHPIKVNLVGYKVIPRPSGDELDSTIITDTIDRNGVRLFQIFYKGCHRQIWESLYPCCIARETATVSAYCTMGYVMRFQDDWRINQQENIKLLVDTSYKYRKEFVDSGEWNGKVLGVWAPISDVAYHTMFENKQMYDIKCGGLDPIFSYYEDAGAGEVILVFVPVKTKLAGSLYTEAQVDPEHPLPG